MDSVPYISVVYWKTLATFFWRNSMSYDAKVFKVMIASPGDVAKEREILRDVMHEWNTIHSEARSIVLLPVGWETDFSPEMGHRPQEIINKRILEKCDMLVGVFWTRIGTETGEYPSGTVEEIETHIKLGKPAMLYFSNKPVHPDSIDQEQYSKLKGFKQSCQTRGIYETYDDLGEFRKKFFRQLQLKINEDEIFTKEVVKEIDDPAQGLKSSAPQLSKEAQILLKEACQEPSGMIFCLKSSGGTEIGTNDKNLIPDQARRTVAKWEAAIEELVTNGYILDAGSKGEVFEVTDKGFQLADTLGV